jgi:hypothetical protein
MVKAFRERLPLIGGAEFSRQNLERKRLVYRGDSNSARGDQIADNPGRISHWVSD